LRAGQLRAEIGEIDGKLKEKSEDLTDAQKENSKSLTATHKLPLTTGETF